MQKLLDKCSHQIVHKLQKTKHQTNKSTGNCMKIYENSYVSKNYVHLFLFLHILIPAYLYHVFFFPMIPTDLYRKLGNLHQEDASKGPNMVIFGCYESE